MQRSLVLRASWRRCCTAPVQMSTSATSPSIGTSSSILTCAAARRAYGENSFQSRSKANRRDQNDTYNELDIARPVDIQAAEKREYQIYTYQEFVQKNELDGRLGGSTKEQVDRVFANPWWIIIAMCGVGFAGIVVMIGVNLRRERMRFDPKMRNVRAIDGESGPSIGGPFSLVGVDGKRYTEKDFLGKWMYIYFGFTNCPDVCPQEMAKMSRMITQLDKQVGKDYWQPIFISVDPKRDTPESIKNYLSDFHPRILGLTGTPDEILEAARQYRVFYSVADGMDENTDDYLVDHTIIMFLMNPEGKFCDYTTKEFAWFEVYTKLLRRMMDYEKKKGIDAKLQGVDSKAVRRVANIGSVMEDTDVDGIGPDANRFGQRHKWVKDEELQEPKK